MSHKLEKARTLARSIRFSADSIVTSPLKNGEKLIAFRDGAYKHGLEISEFTTPGLWISLQEAFMALDVPSDAINAFVYASSEIQAECFSGADDICVIRFSSTLVELLEPDEFKFVAGHELAHFLLSHGGSPTTSMGLEFFSSRRAQEISADRLGFVACGSIEIAVRALMKTMSGLRSGHLRFDVSKYISQLNNVSKQGQRQDGWNTHPSMAVRCRALLWFSMARGFGKNNGYEDPLQKIDLKIMSDLNSDGDRHLSELVLEAEKDLNLWMLAQAVVSQGSFTKGMQKVFEIEFGTDILEKLKKLLETLSSDDIEIEILRRVETSKSSLFQIAPSRANSIILKFEAIVAQQVARFDKLP